MFAWRSLLIHRMNRFSNTTTNIISMKTQVRTEITGRPLGNLERLFYEDRKIIPNMVLLSCCEHVNMALVRSALEILVTLHPLLRMTIKEKNAVPVFTELEKVPIDIHCYNTDDWFSASQNQYVKPFEHDKPFWRFSVIENERNMKDSLFQFVFTMHHSIVDFPYSFVITMDFLKILKDLQDGVKDKKYKTYPFLPAIEQMKGLEYKIKNDTTEKCFEIGNTNSTITSLEAYEHFYGDEIQTLASSERVIGAFTQQQLDQHLSKTYLERCKSENITTNSAILASIVLSLGRLLEQKGCNRSVKIEFSYMANLRRYLEENTTSFHPGLAVVACPISVHIDLPSKKSVSCLHWSLARNVRDQISHAIKNRTPIQVLGEDIYRSVKNGRKKGKSSNVFISSHVEIVKDLEPKLKEKFQILDFEVITDVKIDYFPIFVVLSSIVEGTIHLGAGYSSNYTSAKTAQTFVDNIKLIMSQSIQSKPQL